MLTHLCGKGRWPNAHLRHQESKAWSEVSAGNAHTCAVQVHGAERELWCWGYGHSGRLGTGETADWLIPWRVAGGHQDWLTVSAGGSSTYAVRPNGAWSWGANNVHVQLGDGTAEKAPRRRRSRSVWRILE